MKIKGTAKKDGKWLAVLMPSIAAYTQARTREGALSMAKNCICDLLNQPGLEIDAQWVSESKFEVSVDDLSLLPRILQTARLRQGLSVEQAALRIGSCTPNAWRRYELQGCNPTLRQLKKLLQAVGLSSGFVAVAS